MEEASTGDLIIEQIQGVNSHLLVPSKLTSTILLSCVVFKAEILVGRMAVGE